MKILITGANGQLGRELNNQLKDSHELLLTEVNDLDITDYTLVEKYINENKPDIVINAAAYTAVDLCEEHVDLAYNVNALGPKNLAIATNELEIPLIHISTDYVFDGQGILNSEGKVRLYNEFDEVSPVSSYGKSKLEGERFVQSHNPKHFIVRTAWLYGDGHNFVKTMLTLSEKYDQLKVVDDQVGSPTSTYELTKAILLLLDSTYYGIYHGTCEGICSWYDFTKEIFRLKGIDVSVKPCTSEEYPRPAKRPAYSGLENKRFNENYNYKFAEWQMAIKKYLLEV